VNAIRRCRERLRTGLLTNNIASLPGLDPGLPSAVDGLFDVVIESSRVGLRKPDPAIYRLACAELVVEPDEVAFLDDIGANLKPARALGMVTIKVEDPDAALDELEAVVGFSLR
jgi:putative hydrolase of the HAD superfamily